MMANKEKTKEMACRHENHFAALQAVWEAGNHNFCFALHHLHQCVERSRVFAQPLSVVEGEIFQIRYVGSRANRGCSGCNAGSEASEVGLSNRNDFRH